MVPLNFRWVHQSQEAEGFFFCCKTKKGVSPWDWWKPNIVKATTISKMPKGIFFMVAPVGPKGDNVTITFELAEGKFFVGR